MQFYVTRLMNCFRFWFFMRLKHSKFTFESWSLMFVRFCFAVSTKEKILTTWWLFLVWPQSQKYVHSIENSIPKINWKSKIWEYFCVDATLFIVNNFHKCIAAKLNDWNGCACALRFYDKNVITLNSNIKKVHVYITLFANRFPFLHNCQWVQIFLQLMDNVKNGKKIYVTRKKTIKLSSMMSINRFPWNGFIFNQKSSKSAFGFSVVIGT